MIRRLVSSGRAARIPSRAGGKRSRNDAAIRPARGEPGKLAAAALAACMCAAVGVGVAFPATARAQCAMCRSAFDSPEGRRMIRKYQIGIALLLVVPFATFGTVAFFAVRGRRKLNESPTNSA